MTESIFDVAARALAEQERGQQPADEFEGAARQLAEAEQLRLRTSLAHAVERNPDGYARVRDLAKRTGLPEPVVERNVDVVDRRARVNEFEQMLRDFPVLREFLMSEEFAALAHDDLSALERIEMYWRALGSGLIAFGGTAPNAFLEALTRAVSQNVTDPLARAGVLPEDPLREAADYFTRQREYGQSLQQRVAGDRPTDLSSTEQAILSGIESAGMNFAALGAGLVTRNPQLALWLMSLGAGSLKYGDAVAAGKDPNLAFHAAIGEAGFELLTEMLPVSVLFKDLERGAPFYKIILNQLAQEIPQEQAATILQDFNDWMVLNPDKTLVEFLRERPEAAYQTLVATIVGTGIQTGAITVADRTLARFTGDDVRRRRAQEELRRLTQLAQLASESKLRARAPDSFAEFVQRAAEEVGDVTEVFVDARVFGEVLNQAGISPDDVSPEIARQFREAAPVGGDIRIPVGEFAARIAPEAYGQELLQHLRTSPEGMSAAEAAQFEQEVAAQFREEAEKALAQQEDNEAFQAEAQQVEEILLGELARANRFTADVNNAYAAMVRDFYVTLADRLGVTPLQLYERYPLRIVATPVADPLEQLPPEQIEVDRSAQDIGEFVIFGRDAEGNEIAHMQVEDRGDVLQIRLAAVNESRRGEGIGQQLIQEAWKLAQEEGKPLVSDRAVSRMQLHVYEALKRKGWTIEYAPTVYQAGKPTTVEAALRSREGLGVTADGPVVTRIEPPAAALPVEELEQVPATDIPETIEMNGAERPTANSNGQPIAATEEGIRNFWRWFGDSKVVDAQGRPLVVYRGAAGAITELDGFAYFTDSARDAAAYAELAALRRLVDENDELASVVTEILAEEGGEDLTDLGPQRIREIAEANGFALPSAEGEITSAYLRIENPLDLTEFGSDVGDVQELWNALYERGLLDEPWDSLDQDVQVEIESDYEGKALYRFLEQEGILERAFAQGHDGVVFIDVAPDGRGAHRTFVVQDSRQVKSTENRGTFDPTSPNILEQGPVTDIPETIEVDGVERPTRNSNGQLIHPTEEGIRNFWRWFGDSAPVDEQGRPLVVYHGTNQSFDSFSKERLGKNTTAASSIAFFFTESPAEANEYANLAGRTQVADAVSVEQRVEELQKKIARAEARGDWDLAERLYLEMEEVELGAINADPSGHNIMPVYLRIQRPYVLDMQGSFDGHKVAEAILSAKAEGYDGLKLENVYDPVDFRREEQFTTTQWIALEPEQIKSAIGNVGTFDPSSPNIFEQAPITESDAFKKWFGDSKVVDENGEPLVVYHGTRSDITAFEPGRDGAIYFTDSPEDASAFAGDFRGLTAELQSFELGGANVIPAFLSIRNPLEHDFGGELFDPDSVERVIRRARREGHDGVIIRNIQNFEGGDTSTTYIVFRPEQVKSAIGNVGTFDPTDPSILRQEARGQISSLVSQGGGATIALLRTADLSTFLHEAGHFFLEVYADLASRPDTPQQIRDDFDALLKWFGVESVEAWNAMSLEQKRPHHEKFARGFEAYLFEGKAPTTELQSLFQRFRAWLLNVYRSLTALKVELTDEVRAVMGRMLAADQAIAATEQARQFTPLFESAEQAGMTPEEWERYQEMHLAAREAASDELQRRSLRDMQWASRARSRVLKQLQRDAMAKRKAIRAEVADEVAREPIYRVIRWLSSGEITTPDGEEIKAEKGYKLDVAALEEMYPPGELAEHPDWQKLRPRFASSTGTQHPDTIAELFGFRSGDHLVRALLEAEPMDDVIEALTDRRMLERYGDITDPRALERAADEAVHNDARARFVATEIRALTRTVEGRGVRGGYNVMMKAAREFARQTIARRKIRSLSPAQFAAAQTRAARAADRALAKGDRVQAAAEKRNQLVNLLAVRAAYDAQNEIERGLRYLKKFERDAVRAKLAPDYLEQIDAILERFDLRKGVTGREAERRKSLLEWVEAQREEGFDPDIPPEILAEARRMPYRELTVEEFRGLVDSVKQIEHLARLKNKLLTAKKQREFDEAVAEAARTIEENARRTLPDELEAPKTKLQFIVKGTKEFFAMHRKLASVARQMDGFKDGGTIWELFVRPLNEAGDREAAMRAEATRELSKIFEPLLKRRKLHRKVDIPEIGRSLSWEGILSIALNWGNETNRKRVMEGDKWTPEQVQAILSKLTKEDWDFVQQVWDFIDSYWPQIADKQQRVYGIAPEKVEATPVETPFGTYRGGYYPIAYDPQRSSRSAADTDAEAIRQALQGAYTRATTRRGHTKQRVDSVQRPMRKDFGVLFQHVNNVIHDLTHHEVLIDVQRLLRAPAIDQAIRRHYGPQFVDLMRRAFDDIARGDQPAQNVFERGINHLRTGATVVGLGWNLSTAMLQPLGLTQSVVRIGPQWVARGLSRWLGSPKRMNETVEWIYEKSEFMKSRAATMQREINEVQNRVAGKKLTDAQQSFFWLIQKMQLVADIPTWLGAYEKAMAEGRDEDTAIALADQAVIDSQGGGQVKDLAAIQRGGPLMKLWTNFYSYFNTLYNLLAESVHRTDLKSPKSIGRLAVDFVLLVSVPAVLGEVIRQALGAGGDDDDDELAERLLKLHLSYLFGTMVGLRDLGGVIEGYEYKGPGGLRALDDLARLIQQAEQGEVDAALLRSLNNTAGAFFHYPAGQVERTVTGIKALLDGETENPGVLVVGHKED